MERDEYEKLAFLEGTCGWNVGRRRILESTLRRFTKGSEDLKILEVGCGTGGNIRFLKKFGRTSGLDSNPVALAYAAGKGFQDLVLGSVESIPYADGAFDVVASLDVLEHIGNDAAALKEMYRVLKDGGLLLLTVPAHPWLWTQHDEALHHHRRYTLKGLREKIGGAGFRIEKFSPYMMPTMPYLLIRGLLDKFPGASKREKAASYHATLPWIINNGLLAWIEAERMLLEIMTLPFGGSVLVVAKKVGVGTGLRSDTERPTDSRLLRSILTPFAVFAATVSLYLATWTPSIFHNDAFDFLHAVSSSLRNGTIHAAHWPGYWGWISLLTHSFKARAVVPFDALTLILHAKLFTVLFTGAASAGLYLVAKRLFASGAFALLIAAVFAANPIIWYWGQSAMSDIPALAGMLFSFLSFVKFYQTRKESDLVVASILVGVTSLIRLHSLIVLLPFLTGILLIALERPRQALLERLKVLLRLGVILGACSSVLPLIAYGLPWNFALKGPSLFPGLSDLAWTIRWYVLRDAGWFWTILAWAGLAIGLSRRKTRPFALMLIAGIVASVLYIADWYSKTGGDTDRYVIATIPFTLLGIGFLWSAGRRWLIPFVVSLYALFYVISVAAGLRAPDARMGSDASMAEKLMLLPYMQASSAAVGYKDSLSIMIEENALGAGLPDGTIFLVPASDWSVSPFFLDAYGKPGRRIIWIDDRVPAATRYDELSSIPAGRFVAVHPQLRGTQVEEILTKSGFVPKGTMAGAALLMK